MTSELDQEVIIARSDVPTAHRPDRIWRLNVGGGLEVAVSEWGNESAQPLLMAHGGFDFSGTFDVFAPLLAEAGLRVISWDHRGHGDSDLACLYSFDADIRDAALVLDSINSNDSIPVLGHSKGGGIMNQLADALPHRISAVINLDGIPNERGFSQKIDRTDVDALNQELSGYLDHRRKASNLTRRPDTLAGLAQRRQAMNPRLAPEWLRYLVTVGARKDSDGWRWKIDPALRFGPTGAWNPQWAIPKLRGLQLPYLGIIGTVEEEMGWGTTPDEALAILPIGAEFHALAETGHFVHIERPAEVSAIVLRFLGKFL